ncbi:MAG: citrate (Si)-synthase [Desulfuromonas sp.]|nr:citrate (Si)-synthase [Desulfuromonas sp.]
MSTLKQVLEQKIAAQRPRVTKLVKEFGDVSLGEVTISQAIGGARGVKCLVTDISYLDPMEGIRFRGMTIPETFAALPKVPGSNYPYVEGFWFLLMTGDVPTMEQTLEIVADWKEKSVLPQYVIDVVRALPRDSHPMVMFSAGILAMQRDSVFSGNYAAGKFNKMTCWEDMLEDCNFLMAKLAPLAAYIYRMKYKADVHIPADPNLDMGGNFAHMIGQSDEYKDVARMYFILHSDHESGNVSAHTTHLVASALSDIFYSYSAGINGLAGPLHGLANEEVLRWTQNFMSQLGGQVPTKEGLKEALWATLNSGQVIPGYGHAVLRKTDPRYTSQREFCLNTEGLKDYPLFQLVSMIYEIAPDVLLEQGKAKNPWPNVDAQSGVIQWYYGLVEYEFYTVLFGVGRALGCLPNVTWDRALGYAIERPKSVTTAMLEKAAGIQ